MKMDSENNILRLIYIFMFIGYFVVLGLIICDKWDKEKEARTLGRTHFSNYTIKVTYYNGDKEVFKIKSRLEPEFTSKGSIYIYPSEEPEDYGNYGILANGVRTCNIIKK